MHICIYGHNLSVFTSGFPMRGLVKELIKLRVDDNFTIVLRDDRLKEKFAKFYNELSNYDNLKFLTIPLNKKLSQLKLMLGLENYAKFNFNADIYLTISVDYFGAQNKPLINILGDLSSLRIPSNSTLKWHGKIMLKNSLKFAYKYVDHLTCISNFTRHDLLNLFPNIEKKTSVLYNGIEDEWFDDKYELIDVKEFTDSKAGYWIWYGYISKRKNILNLLKAYKLLIDQKINYVIPKILLVGKLAPNQKIVTDYINNNLNDSVRIIPHQDFYKLKYLVKNSKGLLFPSYYEGFGLPVIEAFSQGKPVMHSEVSSLPEIAEGLGIECDPYSVESIKNALLKMGAIKEDQYEIIKRKQWASRFTYKNAAEQFSIIIDEVIANSK